MPNHRRPFAAFLRRRHRPAVVIPPPERITCRHGLVGCDHCRPLFRTGTSGMDYETLPADDTPDAGHCAAECPGDLPYHCTEADEHEGHHRAADGLRIVAEWEA